MDTLLQGFSNSMNEFKFDRNSISSKVCSSQSLVNGFKINGGHVANPPFLPPNPTPINLPPSSSSSSSSLVSSEGEDPSENAVLKYIRDMLMEEDLEGKTCMIQDCMALQAAERSFYDVLGAKYPPPPPNYIFSQNSSNFSSTANNFPPLNDPDDNFSQNSSNFSFTANNLLESNWVGDKSEFESSNRTGSLILSPSQSNSQSSSSSSNSFSDSVDGLVDSPIIALLVSEVFSERKSTSSHYFRGGATKKIIPNGNCVIVDLDPEEKTPLPPVIGGGNAAVKSNGSSLNGRKHHHSEEGDYLEEGRSNKQSAVYTEVSDVSEMFDKVLLCNNGNNNESSTQESSKRLLQHHQNGQSKASNGRTTRGKKQGNKRDLVDLSTLLTQCAQAVASNDHKTATELLRQIRQHSSPNGDGSQRLAHYFANSLEARLAGTRGKLHTILATRTSAADILKAYQVYVTACPFKKMSNFFANKTIIKLAEKATSLHIIDFGIAYGFQWPCLIQGLSRRPGGPPKLRITGIELPQPGFRPAERVEETGRRLENYCKRFNVPFEYNAIAQKWETIRYEDLKIERDEVLVVNSLYRLRNLLDETVMVNSPRDAVLKLIKRINPDIFIHGIINGTYNAPFFLTRFRETLFHFSALFDMFDATIPSDDQERMLFEQEIFGRDATNIIACEGSERVDRPETYKQWQVRNMRAGLQQLPLDEDILAQVRSRVKLGYHKDFVVDVNSKWMLQGWKGRIIYALSCWKPVSN